MSKRSFIPDSSSSGERKKRRVDPRVPIYDEKTGKRVPGVRKTRNGERYECKIYHPITYKDIWIGTFDTIQQASEAYEAKKKQLLESCRGGVICGEFDFKSRVFDDKSGERIAGVWRTRTGDRYDTRIRDPVTRKDVWIGTFDTIQQASEAYNAKKREFDQAAVVQGGRRRGRDIDDTDPVFNEKSGERIDGVWKWKRGRRYVAKILHPSTRKYVCVGTFDTYQKASVAYQAKKKELDDQAAKMRRVGEFDWEEVTVSDTKSSEEIQEPMEEEALEWCADNFRVSNSPESNSDRVEVLVENDCELDNQSRKTQKTSQSSPDHTKIVKPAPGESSKEPVSSMAYFDDLQKKSVWVKSEEYRGGGALGFLIPTKGGGESFMPFMDNHGFLLGEFSKVDDLSLSDRAGKYNNLD